jgi:hypothetical protein
LVVESNLAVEELVHFATASSVKQDDLFATTQSLAQIYLDRETGFPSVSFHGLTPDLDVDPVWVNVLVLCDRSDGQRDSTAQGSGHQLDRAAVNAAFVVSAFDFE